MATTNVIEEERGTYVSSRHPHNGYYAGRFDRAGEDGPSLSMVVLRAAAITSIR